MEFGVGNNPVLSILLSPWELFFRVCFIAQPTWHQKRLCFQLRELLLVLRVGLGLVCLFFSGKRAKYQGSRTVFT